MVLRIEDKLLFASVRLHPEPEDILLMENLAEQVDDWNYFTGQAIRCGFGPLLYKNLPLIRQYERIPEATKHDLNQIYLRSLARNMIIYEHFHRAVKAFTEQGVSVIALKGIYLASHLYPDPGLRQMSDIDLLVDLKDVDTCKNILVGLGYQQAQNYLTSSVVRRMFGMKHLPGLVLNGVSFEIHSRLHAANRGYRFNIGEFYSRSVPVIIQETRCRALETHDLVLHLCVHLYEHLGQPLFQLYRFCDISELLKLHRQDFDWDLFLDRCKTYQCTSQVTGILNLAREFFGAPVPNPLPVQNPRSGYRKVKQLFMNRLLQSADDRFPQDLALEIRGIENAKGIKRELKIIFGLVFPGISYMKQRYRKENAYGAFPYYFLRIWKAVCYLLRKIP
ncbi:MAG: hypothetical protein EOM90_08525 [Alphaproteobacteria bacterium]|nr:hypothetical protein [Alphaproteobacteria bacterium]